MDPSNPMPDQTNAPNNLFASPSLPGGVQSPPAPTKKSKKKYLIAGVAVLAALVICGAVLLIPQKKQSPSQVQETPVASPAEQTVGSYIQAVQAKEYKKAFALTSIKGMSEEDFTKTLMPIFVQTTRIESCEIKEDSQDDAQSVLLYCPYVNGGGALYEYFTEAQTDGSVRIVKIETVREDKPTNA